MQRCVRLQGEYAGEMITLAEAERRGSVWDALDSSFIFQLNGAWAVDSRKAGHLLKHASPLAAFCLAACVLARINKINQSMRRHAYWQGRTITCCVAALLHAVRCPALCCTGPCGLCTRLVHACRFAGVCLPATKVP